MEINYLSHAKQAIHNAHKADSDAELYKARGWHDVAWRMHGLADTYRRLAGTYMETHQQEMCARDAVESRTGWMEPDDLAQLCPRQVQRSMSDLYRARLNNLINRFPRRIWSEDK